MEKKKFLSNSPRNLEDLDIGSSQPLHIHLINLVNMLLLITSFNFNSHHVVFASEEAVNIL